MGEVTETGKMNMENKNIVSTLFENIKNIIEQSKHYAVTQVNYSLVIAYWNIGKMIKENIIENKRAEYGEETVKNDLALLSEDNKMTTALFLRDPYFLDFLELKDNYSEKDIENAILIELEKFILEFGNDFAFMARQKRIQIGDFMPEYKGQVELYLKWLSKYEKQDFEEEPIAIILCSGKDSDVVELMDLEKDNIHISEYWLKLPPKEVLKEKLHKAVGYAKARMASQGAINGE